MDIFDTSHTGANAPDLSYLKPKPGDKPHDIGWAVKQMHNGQTVRRSCGWNGKGMFLFLVPGQRTRIASAVYRTHLDGPYVDLQPCIMMRTANGTVVPWFCSQSDLLALDWEVAE